MNCPENIKKTWRVAQLQATAEYDIFDGLKAKALVGYYLAYQQMNNQEYTYKLYGYDEATDTYPVIFENNNPWRERRGTQRRIDVEYSTVLQ